MGPRLTGGGLLGGDLPVETESRQQIVSFFARVGP